MSGFWLGRRTWLWLADGVLVAFGIALLLTGNEATRLIAVFIVVSRLLFAGVQVLVWKRRQAATGDDDRLTPPR